MKGRLTANEIHNLKTVARSAELEAFINEEALECAIICHKLGCIADEVHAQRFFRAFRRLCPGDYASFKDGCDGNDPELFQFLKELEDEDA